MSALVLRIGGRALLEADVAAQLRLLARICLPEELAEWRADLARGTWVFVAMRVFGETADEHGVTRHDDDAVHGLLFARPHTEDNLQHAREVVHTHLDALQDALRRDGVLVATAALERAPVVIELAPALERALAPQGRRR